MSEGSSDQYIRVLEQKVVQLEEDIHKLVEQKRAQDALIENEQKYRALHDNVTLAYQSLDENGHFLDVNPTWLNMLGYQRAEVIGAYFGDFLHPNWKIDFEKNFADYKKHGYIHDAQFKICHKGGHFLDISYEGYISYHPDGSFKQTYCVFQDITARKQAETELANRVSELSTLHQIGVAISSRLELEKLLQYIVEQTASVLNSASSAVLLLDEQTGDLVFSAAADEIIGMRVPAGKGVVGRVLKNNTIQIVEDLQVDPDHYWGIAEESGIPARSMLAVPLKSGEEAFGVLTAIDKEGGLFNLHDADLLTIIASHAASAIENAKLHGELQDYSKNLEARVEERTAELRKIIHAMAGREVRMAELKSVIKKLRSQLKDAGMTPLADDPLLGELPE